MVDWTDGSPNPRSGCRVVQGRPGRACGSISVRMVVMRVVRAQVLDFEDAD